MEKNQVKPATINGGLFLMVLLLVLGSSNLDSWTNMLIGVTGAFVGCAYGAYAAIKGAKSPQERTFVWVWAIVALLLFVSFAVAWVVVPGWYRFLLFIPFALALFLLVRYGNRKFTDLKQKQGGTFA
jgi:hypothetical protein